MRENLTSGSMWQGMETRRMMPRRHSPTLLPDQYDSPRQKELVLCTNIFRQIRFTASSPPVGNANQIFFDSLVKREN